MYNVLFKTLRDKKFFILGWSVGLLTLGLIMTVFFPSFNGGQVDSLIDAMPAAFQGLVGDLQDWRQLPGYIGSQVFDIRLPIFIAILSILLAVSLTVGEEDKGQLRTLTSLPVSRHKIAFAKWLGIVVICLIASLATVVGVLAGLPIINETIGLEVLVRLGLFTWIQATAVATIIFAIGLTSGRRSLTTGLAIVLTIGSFLLSSFASAVDWLEKFEFLSIFYYFPAVEVAKGTIEWGNVAFYVVATFAALLVALIVFPRRDIKS